MRDMSKRKRKLPPINVGRPTKQIDWEIARELAEAHCSGSQIAAFFDIHEKTFYERVQSDLGMRFTEFAEKYRESGKSKLLKMQFKIALDAEKPSEKMLIWLGKQELKQRERFPDEEGTEAQLVININKAPYNQEPLTP